METLRTYLRQHRDLIYPLVRRMIALEKPFLLRSEVWDEFLNYLQEIDRPDLQDSFLGRAIAAVQEAAVESPWIYLAGRPDIATWRCWRLHADTVEINEVDRTEYLKFKERIITGVNGDDRWVLEVDLGPFNIWVAMGIATVKASLVCLFFMHLWWDRPFHSIVLVAAIVLMALFLGMSAMDTAEYKPYIIENPTITLGTLPEDLPPQYLDERPEPAGEPASGH